MKYGLAISGAVAALVASALSITATFAPAWVTNGTRYTGFFGSCIEGNCTSSTDFFTATVETSICATTMIMGTFLLLIGSLLILSGLKKSPTALKEGGVVTGIGGAIVLFGAIFFTRYLVAYDSALQNTFCFAMAWLAGFLGIGGGVLIKMEFYLKESSYQMKRRKIDANANPLIPAKN